MSAPVVAAPPSAAAPARTLVVVLAIVALLGNGSKALLTSTVLVSEGAFAALLQMTPEQVAALLQVVVAGMVVALALAPALLQHVTARVLGLATCALAIIALVGFAAVDIGATSETARIGAAFAGLSIAAGALALLAPVAQSLVSGAPRHGMRTALTTLWTLATPAGFLAAPQLVKLALPALGLGRYFALLAILPAILCAALALVRPVPGRVTPQSDTAQLPLRLTLAFVAVIVIFEIGTAVADIRGLRSPLAWVALAALVPCCIVLWRTWRATPIPAACTGPWQASLATLFVLQVPTTGFFDTAFLVSSGYPEAFIANRATLGAAAQIAGTLAASALVHRAPRRARTWRLAFAAIAGVGVALFLGYPLTARTALLYAAPMITGFGAAGLTLLLCLDLVRDAARAPLVAAFPSLAIMLGTEFGLESLQMAYALAGTAHGSETVRYTTVFVAQLGAALAIPLLLLVARRRATLASGT